MVKAGFCSLLALATSSLYAPLYAQKADPQMPLPNAPSESAIAAQDSSARIFTLKDFEQFAPQTALDMVRRVPGFTIEQADSRRGLGQGGSNVLINGKRFAGKSNDIVSALGRISATSVIRIELVDGATLDIPGLSGQVVNVVSNVTGLTGQFRWSPSIRTRSTAPQLYDGEVSISGVAGGIDYTISLENDSGHNGTNGPETVFDGMGNITEIRDERLLVSRDRPKLSGSFSKTTASGSSANLNFAVERPRANIREFSDSTVRNRIFRETEDEYNYEIGADYEFGIDSDRLKLIGLHRFEHSPFFVDVRFAFPDASPDRGDRQRRVTDEKETIFRAEYSISSGKADWQFSAEGALNSLSNATELATLQPDGSYLPIILFGANSNVEEQRAELTGSYSRPLSSSLDLQLSLGGEYSRLSQSGPLGLTRSFVRPKGFVSLAWKASPTLDISGKLEREVGQLNFFDFVASADIGSGNNNAANPNLVPPQSWNVEIEANKSLGGYGSLSLKSYARFLTDVVDQIPIGPDGEAPGNIDSATAYGIETNGTLKLDRLGWQGARFDVSLEFKKSRIRDPLTDQIRRISNDFVRFIDIEFRQDIPGSDWAYGGEYEEYREARGFRLNQVSRARGFPGGLSVFVENKDIAGLKVRGGVSNLLDTNETFTRTIYEGRRNDSPILFTESRDRFFGPVFLLDVSGTF